MLELIAWGFIVLWLCIIVGAVTAAFLMWLAARAIVEPPSTDQDFPDDDAEGLE